MATKQRKSSSSNNRKQPIDSSTFSNSSLSTPSSSARTPVDVERSKENVTVTVRFRPLSPKEIRQGEEVAWYADGDTVVRNEYNPATAYAYDRVFGPTTTTRHVYDVAAQEVVTGAMEGINGTIFAYGVTSSGKTHTMHGDQRSPGIIPLAVKDAFSIIQETPSREFLLRVSYLEIYNEVVNDLLNPEGQNLRIREDIQGTFVEGIKEEVVLSPAHALSLIAAGEAHRHVGSTNFNLLSSRSHTIFTLTIESSPYGENPEGEAVNYSQLNLIDLAGSESSRVETTGIRRKEGSYINKSLLTLGTVISKLTDGRSSHIPYRDSKLTRLLQSSLSGHGRVSLICNVTPSSSNSEETHNTLKFAHRAKHIEIQAAQNKIIDEKSLIKKYQHEISSLKEELEQLRRGIGSVPPLKSVGEENIVLLKQKLEDGQVKLQSRLEEEEEAKAALLGRIQRLTKLILVSTNAAPSSRFPQRPGPRRRHSFGEEELAYLPYKKKDLILDEENIDLYVSLESNGEIMDDTLKEEKKGRKNGLLNWFKLRKKDNGSATLTSIDGDKSSGTKSITAPSTPQAESINCPTEPRISNSLLTESTPSADNLLDVGHDGDVHGDDYSAQEISLEHLKMEDQIDLLREQQKILAGEVALHSSALKRLSEEAAHNPEKEHIHVEIRRLSSEIKRKNLHIASLEKQIDDAIFVSCNKIDTSELSQSFSDVMAQLNEKSFELEVRTADNRIIQEQLNQKICECEALEETVASLKEQLSNASEIRISSQQAANSQYYTEGRSSEGENLMTMGRNVDNENLRLLQGGIILGPSVLGNWPWFVTHFFPLRSVMVLETMANLGLLYFLFLVGVEMDLEVIKRTGKKAFVIAICGMIVPFIIGSAFASMTVGDKKVAHTSYLLFIGVAVSVTAFPVLARILAELKLLNTELGRIAMSAAVINDMCAWIVLAVAIALADKEKASLASIAVISCSVVFVLLCVFIVRPAIYWVIRRTPEGENVNDIYICLILTGVMICGFVTDIIGTHSIFGAFVYGLVIPNGPLGASLIEKLEDFVTGLLLPLFFAISGLRTKLAALGSVSKWGFLCVIIVLASAAKVGITLLLAVYYQMPVMEGLALGLLMNTKGLIEMIILNVGKDQQVLDDSSFSMMVVVSVVTTFFITPTIMAVYRPARRFAPYKRRTIQTLKQDSELRILTCIHTPRNVPTIINLLEASHPVKKSPIYVYALHLVELTGRASAMLIVHNTRKSGGTAINRTQAQSDHIINAFENYEQHAGGVSVQPLTAISPYSTMHEDICNLAEDKRVALIILPFHKQQTVDGGMEATNPAYRTINQNVLANAPCSVGILVDRGLGGSTRVAASHISHHVVVLFFGGPDDREAISYASRMAEHPGISLTVIRFIPGQEARESTLRRNESTASKDQSILTVVTDNDKERQSDEDFINTFRLKTVNNESIVFIEKVVNNGEETVAAIRSIDSIHDLYIVGRGQGITPLTAGLTDWSECPELGAIGDLLASSDFAATVSVLVVQQYVGMGLNEGLATPDSPAQQNDYFNSVHGAAGLAQPRQATQMAQRGMNPGYGNSWNA